MTYIQTIQSIELKLQKQEKISHILHAILFVSSVYTVAAIIPYYLIDWGPFLTVLIPMVIALWFVVLGWGFIVQAHIWMTLDLYKIFTWWKEAFKRVWRRHGIRAVYVYVGFIYKQPQKNFRRLFGKSRRNKIKTIEKKQPRRIHHNKRIPEPAFYEKIDQYNGHKLNKNGNPRKIFLDFIMEEHEINGDMRKLYCYKVSDIKRKYRLPLKRSTARKLAKDYLSEATHK